MKVPFNDLLRAAEADSQALDAAAAVLAGGWYLLGEQTTGFESELGTYLETGDVVTVANGTDALELALGALTVPGDEVVMAANAGGYAAAAAARRSLRIRYADVDTETLLLSTASLEAAISQSTKVVVVTHLYGQVAPMPAIGDLCTDRGVAVIEDCAQSAGARLGGRPAGSFGDAATFSFYPTKNLGAMGDAGAVATTHGAVAERVRQLRQYGWSSKYVIACEGGRNSRMDEVQAAVLRTRLPRLAALNERRRAIAARYRDAVDGSPARLVGGDGESYVAHLAVLSVPADERDSWRESLHAAGIATDVHYPIPDHRQKGIGDPEARLPVTERAASEILSLPCFPELRDHEVDAVCDTLHALAVES